MNRPLRSCVLAAGLAAALPVLAQTAPPAPQPQASPPAQPVSAAKKELVAKVLKLQQPALEQLGRALAEGPAQQMVVQARAALQRVPADKRETVAKEIDAEVRKYLDEAVPVVRNKAVALAPSTIAPILEQRFTEDELKQIVAILESPVNAKFQQLAPEMQRALGDRLVNETKGTVEPKVQALRQSMSSRIDAAVPKTN